MSPDIVTLIASYIHPFELKYFLKNPNIKFVYDAFYPMTFETLAEFVAKFPRLTLIGLSIICHKYKTTHISEITAIIGKSYKNIKRLWLCTSTDYIPNNRYSIDLFGLEQYSNLTHFRTRVSIVYNQYVVMKCPKMKYIDVSFHGIMSNIFRGPATMKQLRRVRLLTVRNSGGFELKHFPKLTHLEVGGTTNFVINGSELCTKSLVISRYAYFDMMSIAFQPNLEFVAIISCNTIVGLCNLVKYKKLKYVVMIRCNYVAIRFLQKCEHLRTIYLYKCGGNLSQELIGWNNINLRVRECVGTINIEIGNCFMDSKFNKYCRVHGLDLLINNFGYT